MSVSLDTTAETPFNINVTSITLTQTWSTDDVVGLVFFEWSQTNLPAGLGVTWNGVSMTQLTPPITSGITGANNQVGVFFAILNPGTGVSIHITASWTTAVAQSGYLVAWGFKGFVTSSLNCFKNFATALSNAATSVSLSINSAPGDLVVLAGSAGTVPVTSADIVVTGGTYTAGFTDTVEINSVTGGTSTCTGASINATFTPNGGSSSVLLMALDVSAPPSSIAGFVSSEW